MGVGGEIDWGEIKDPGKKINKNAKSGDNENVPWPRKVWTVTSLL